MVWEWGAGGAGTLASHTSTQCADDFTSCGGPREWDSSPSRTAGTFSHTFGPEDAGTTFLYRCQVHPFTMRGRIIVQGPVDDTDADGFTDEVELHVGTDPNLACGADAWPPDFDSNSAVNINDVFAVLESFGKSSADGDWISGNHIRKDLDANDAININDVFIELDFFAQSCT